MEGFIKKHFKSYENFKDEFLKEAMTIQGSGWAYLAYDGKIKLIKNHEVRDDILLIIDWWEHAWTLDYLADKKEYLENTWTDRQCRLSGVAAGEDRCGAEGSRDFLRDGAGAG